MRNFGKIFAWMVFCAIASQHVVAAQDCRALVVVKDDLWFAQQNGTLLTQLTNDGKLKLAVALAPTSNLIAYSGKSSPADVSLIDSTGRLLADVNLHATDAITDLAWTSSDMLEAGQHESPTSSRFYFLRVPPPAGPAQVLPATGAGGRCALSPRGRGIACTQGDAISLNGRDIYTLPSPFSAADVVQKVNASVGTSVSTTTKPSFRIEIQNIRDDQVALKVTTPDGQSMQTYLRNGDVLPVPYPSESSDGSSALYGVGAEIARHNNGVVTLTVMANTRGTPTFEAGPVWDPRGKRIAFVESNGSNQRWLVLINREMGEADEHRGGHDARERLPIAGPVSSIAFTSDTHIVVKGQDSVFAQDIPAEGKVPGNAPYTTTPRLAQQINVTVGGNLTPVPVRGWTCQ
ncbi:hypothetical protein CJO93_23330 (plasmid) [Ralstonia solanacearum]|uniref:hypothetical protein n=1 Tax=Ralstonia pseudosolanacearum TaxID=1310165 RepID=UPI000856AA4D|nr:hypothetical protein [Ralstonia pseudosolanacearum]AOE92086.1 hypothetical protein LBM341_03836 [Ralstonia solanacearum]AXW60191.1 hypothetical protein CJO93_23330 [Ralstonia solanacearum]NKA16256.1 hypothetical protein [Ralstonia solanacearum]NKA51267.1 hypothetical protein [Ralstonia solanacearum]UYR04574.1 hypothetical protein NQS37_18075 [Ralstonia pseudosolanacearum]